MMDEQVEGHFAKVNEKLDKLMVQTAENTQVLVEHERRSTTLEKEVEILQKYTNFALGGWFLIVFALEAYKIFH